MPAPLSADLRQRIAHAPGSALAVAARFAVATMTVYRLRKRLSTTGTTMPQPARGGPARLVTDDQQQRIATWLTDNPSLTQAELAARLTDSGTPVSRQTAGRTLERMGYTRKKRA